MSKIRDSAPKSRGKRVIRRSYTKLGKEELRASLRDFVRWICRKLSAETGARSNGKCVPCKSDLGQLEVD